MTNDSLDFAIHRAESVDAAVIAWYRARMFHFERAGELRGVGRKFERWLDVTIL